MTKKNISAVEALIKEDPHRTYKDIEGALGISSSSVSTILHQYLRVRKIFSRWVPHILSDGPKCTRVEWCTEMLKRFNNVDTRRVSDIVTGDETWIGLYQFDPETKRQSSVWVFPDEQLPTKVKRQRSVRKKMVATFFSSGHVAAIVLEDQRTVTAKWYTEVWLPQVFSKIQEKRPRTELRGILLHHDNASSHTANAKIAFLEKTLVKLITHPAYSRPYQPGPVRHFPVPEREESHARTPISQLRRCCC